MNPSMAPRIAAARTPLPGGTSANGRGHPEALVESYRRLAEVFHEVMSEQSLDALLDRIAVTLARPDAVRGAAHLRGRRVSPRARAGARPLARVRGRDHERPAQVRRGADGLGRHAADARVDERGPSRPARRRHPGHAERARGDDRRAADRARRAQGRAQHLPARRERGLRRARVRARQVVRRRGGAGARQRADPRAARAPRPDRLADRALQPPLLPRPPPLGADARLALARLGGGADVRPRRLQARQRRLRPRRR